MWEGVCCMLHKLQQLVLHSAIYRSTKSVATNLLQPSTAIYSKVSIASFLQPSIANQDDKVLQPSTHFYSSLLPKADI